MITNRKETLWNEMGKPTREKDCFNIEQGNFNCSKHANTYIIYYLGDKTIAIISILS